MAYALIYGWSVLVSLLSAAAPTARRSLGLAVAVTLVLFCGLRGDSVDYLSYRVMFELMVELDLGYPERFFFGKDLLFGVLMDSLQKLGGDFQAVILAAAVLSIGIKQLAFSRAWRGNTAPAWLVTLCLTLFLHDFTQIRTAIAVAICFVALQALLQGRRRAWFWLLVLASGFHLSTALFMPLSAVLLARPEHRLRVWALVTFGLTAAVLLLYQIIGLLDARIVDHGDLTGLNWTAVAVAAFKLTLLGTMAWRASPPRGAEQTLARRMVWPSLMFAATGVVMLVAFRGVASALAFRFYEFLDAFAVWVVVDALLQSRRADARLLAIGYCAFGVLLQYLPGLFLPYEFAPWAAPFG